MLYFIPWLVFLVGVLLAVPVASWLEKRKYATPKALVEDDPSGEEISGEEEVLSDENVEQAEFGEEANVVADAAFDAPGGDDFSAFEDDFK